MTNHSEPFPQIPPVSLIETPFGFQAHPLELNAHERRLHHAVMEETLDDPRVQHVLSIFERLGDEGTRNHSLGVGWLAAAEAVDLGMDSRDVGLTARAAITHDIGKSDTVIQGAIHSPYTFQEKPENRDIIQAHPMLGSVMLRKYGFGPNESMVAATHHGFQTERPAYGLRGDAVRAEAEPDGYVPPTREIAELVSGADQFEALATPVEVSGRLYRRNEKVDPIKAIQVVNSLAVSDAVKQVVPRVTGYGYIRRRA